jgi:hypothetical protein
MPPSADAVAMISADDRRMSWAPFAAVVLLGWLSVALVVATMVGHGIALGSRFDSD